MTRTCIRLSIVKLPLLKYDKQQDCEHSNTNESNSIQHADILLKYSPL